MKNSKIEKYLTNVILFGCSALIMTILYKSNFTNGQNEQISNRSEVSKSLNEITSKKYNDLLANESLNTANLGVNDGDPPPKKQIFKDNARELALESAKRFEIAESTTMSTLGNAADLRRYQSFDSKVFGEIGYNTLTDINSQYNEKTGFSDEFGKDYGNAVDLRKFQILHNYKLPKQIELANFKISEKKFIKYDTIERIWPKHEKFEIEEYKSKSNFQGNWNNDEINRFKDDCLRGLDDANSQLSNNERKEYCDCVFEKIISKYPDKYQTAEKEFIMKITKECILSN